MDTNTEKGLSWVTRTTDPISTWHNDNNGGGRSYGTLLLNAYHMPSNMTSTLTRIIF